MVGRFFFLVQRERSSLRAAHQIGPWILCVAYNTSTYEYVPQAIFFLLDFSYCPGPQVPLGGSTYANSTSSKGEVWKLPSRLVDTRTISGKDAHANATAAVV